LAGKKDYYRAYSGTAKTAVLVVSSWAYGYMQDAVAQANRITGE
jgi:hypothetical protein